MASTHYWDVTNCRWRACHEGGAGTLPPVSLETDQAALGGAATAATPSSVGSDTAPPAMGPMAPAAATDADVPQA